MCYRWIYAVGFLVLLMLYERTRAQIFPSKDQKRFHRNHPEMFYDSKILPDGIEVTTYLFRGETQRYFFIVERNTPVSIIVTPCTAPVLFKLYLRDMPPLNAHKVADGLQYEQGGGENSVDQTNAREVFSKTDQKRMTYQTDNSPVGIYMIDLLSNGTDSSIRVFATSNPSIDWPYPDLPGNKKIRVTRATSRSLRVSWDPSPTHALLGQKVKYCVALRRRKHSFSHCDALAQVRGDIPPTVPPNAGFGWGWEKDIRKRINAKRKLTRPKNRNVKYACVGKKRRYRFRGLRPKTRYYIDVFAMNPSNNASVRYTGTVSRTKPKVKSTRIDHGRLAAILLRKRNGYRRYRLRVRQSTPKLTIQILSCDGQISADIVRDRKVLKKETFKGLKTIEIDKVDKDSNYSVKLILEHRRTGLVKLFYTTAVNGVLPLPRISNDTSVKVFEHLTTCNSVTVAWLGTEDNLKYCLYKRNVNTNDYQSTYSQKSQCLRRGSRTVGKRVMCRSFRAQNNKKMVMTQTITGLASDTQYEFSVYVSNKFGESILYQSAYTRTKRRCSK
ncbi:protein NDNF-like [Tubulanus polymorphus]|uniref:protein NDNF-like n=1 Tax=Tubulanus polymorphus TaxID=672921 RepID=UPI003DA3C3F7